MCGALKLNKQEKINFKQTKKTTKRNFSKLLIFKYN